MQAIKLILAPFSIKQLNQYKITDFQNELLTDCFWRRICRMPKFYPFASRNHSSKIGSQPVQEVTDSTQKTNQD